MILSEEQRHNLAITGASVREIESAILAKLAEGQKPMAWYDADTGLTFNRREMKDAGFNTSSERFSKLYLHPSAEIAALRAEVEMLRAKMAGDVRFDGALAFAAEQGVKLQEQLAAAQAREQQLREIIDMAFTWIDSVPRDVELPAMPGFDRDQVDAFLSATHNTSALDEIKAGYEARIEQLRRTLTVAANSGNDEWYAYTAEAGRAAIIQALALPTDRSALDAYLAPYKLDAERYRWLKERNYMDGKTVALECFVIESTELFPKFSDEEFDEAIDAAMNGGGK